jgi:predicted phage tail protein
VTRFNQMLTQDRPAPVNPANLVGYDRVIFLMVLGVAFIGFGVYNFGNHGFNWFFAALGVAFFIFGISQFYMTKRIRGRG